MPDLAEISMSSSLIAAVISTIVALFSALAVQGRYILNKLGELKSDNDDQLKQVNEEIGAIKSDYVRRDDLMQHISSIERGQDRLASGLDRVHARLDQLAVGGGSPTRGD